ncbi:MAG: hypothetical protein MZV64_09875 [Ignavibacteriales bacterium]|nr:hypothetical protein [Ignavibacteriales bacterium]
MTEPSGACSARTSPGRPQDPDLGSRPGLRRPCRPAGRGRKPRRPVPGLSGHPGSGRGSPSASRSGKRRRRGGGRGRPRDRGRGERVLRILLHLVRRDTHDPPEPGS